VFDIRPAAVNIQSELLPTSTSSESVSAQASIRMPYTPTSAMSQSAVHVDDSGAAEDYSGDQSVSLEGPVQVLVERGGNAERVREGHGEAVDKRERGVVDMSVLPSPPLTRVGTNESRSTRAGAAAGAGSIVVDAEKEMDIAAWRESMQVADDESDSEVEEDKVDALHGDMAVPEREESGEEAEEDRESEVEDDLSPVIDTGRDPLRSLKIDIRPNTSSPPIWEIVEPGSTDDQHNEVDISSQQHILDALAAKASCVVYRHYLFVCGFTYCLYRSPKRLIPKSAYYYGPPPIDSAFGTEPIGQIGVHHPREVVRIERDYTGGELIQFAHVYPLEFEGRVRSWTITIFGSLIDDNPNQDIGDSIPGVDQRCE
jgi:hypothetical protein